ncbi:hypothetical protein ACFFRR_003055 [Megaselia abdita]
MTETVVTVERAPGVTTTTTTTSSGGLSWMKFNLEYFKSVPGIIKIVQLIIGIICMALASPVYLSATHFFLFVAVTAFICTLLWSFAYLLGIREALNFAINWILTELINTAIWAVFYFIAFVVQLAKWSNAHPQQYGKGSNIAAGVFGILNFIAYSAGAYFLYLEHRGGSTQ